MSLEEKPVEFLLRYRDELFDRLERYLDGATLYPEELDFILETIEKISKIITV